MGQLVTYKPQSVHYYLGAVVSIKGEKCPRPRGECSLRDTVTVSVAWLAMSQAPWGLGSSRRPHPSACPQQGERLVEAQTSTLGGPALLEGCIFLSLMGTAQVLEPLIPRRDIEAPLLPFAHPPQAGPDLSHNLSISICLRWGSSKSIWTLCHLRRPAGFGLSLISTEIMFALGTGEPEWMEESKINDMQSRETMA